MTRWSDRLPRNEVPVDPSSLGLRSPEIHKPRTALQAVMEAGPHEEPVASIEESAEVARLVREAFGALSADERMLMEAIVFERASFRQLEQRMGIPKSTVHRLFAAAVLQMRGILIEHPEIVEYLRGATR